MKYLSFKAITNGLKRAWSRETCYEPLQKYWSIKNPKLGQCYATSLVLNDYFGGEIVRVKDPSGYSHYFNVIQGVDLDLTLAQYPVGTVFTDRKCIDRELLEEIPRYLISKEGVVSRI